MLPSRSLIFYGQQTGYIPGPLPEWRNGRRAGLKIRWGQPRVSSTLTSGIVTPHRNNRRPSLLLLSGLPSSGNTPGNKWVTENSGAPYALLISPNSNTSSTYPTSGWATGRLALLALVLQGTPGAFADRLPLHLSETAAQRECETGVGVLPVAEAGPAALSC